MKEKLLGVTLPGHAVGVISQDRHGAVRWVPERVWESGGQMPRLGLDFLRQPGPRIARSDVPPWFANLLPERGSPLRDRLAAEFGLREGQSFELLAKLGEDLLGAVEARPASAPSAADGARSDRVEPSEAHVAVVASDRPSALTGMQLKLAMSMVKDRMVVSARIKSRLYIVKFPGADYPDLAEVEAATMTWAKRAGFAVPDHFTYPAAKLSGVPEGWSTGDAPVFVVRRFDRRDDGSKIHQEDLCQALGLWPAQKYGEVPESHVSTEGALRLVVDACGESDGRELARRIGFVLASGNTDAHLKNWSLLWGEATRPTLSPGYDLVSTIAWDKLGWRRKGGPTLALALGGVRRFGALDQRAVDAASARTGYAWLQQEILAGVAGAADAWPSVDVPRRMRDAVTTHWARVPLLAHSGIALSK